MMKKECFFREDNVFIFKKPSLLKWEDANYAGGSWVSCQISNLKKTFISKQDSKMFLASLVNR